MCDPDGTDTCVKKISGPIIPEYGIDVKPESGYNVAVSYCSDAVRATEHIETSNPRHPQASVVNESEL